MMKKTRNNNNLALRGFLFTQNIERLGGANLSEPELQYLYELLEKVKNENEKAALRHAIFIIESNKHVY